MIYDRFTCPDAPLEPPEEEEDNTPYCVECGSPHELTYRDKADGTVYGCENCIQKLVSSDTYPHFIDCPACKSEAVYLYMDRSTGKIVGCEECVEVEDAE